MKRKMKAILPEETMDTKPCLYIYMCVCVCVCVCVCIEREREILIN